MSEIKGFERAGSEDSTVCCQSRPRFSAEKANPSAPAIQKLPRFCGSFSKKILT